MKKSLILSNIFTALVIIVIAYFAFAKSSKNNLPQNNTASTVSSSDLNFADTSENNTAGQKTFVFSDFHGSKDVSQKFQFNYPANIYNDGQYFSPEKIEYYDLYSVKAPFYYDLILASIFDQTEFKNQINSSKRNSPDRQGLIDGKEFKRYDLVDYGSYGGDSAGRVIVYVGPTIKINGLDYILVFHWEEKPLTATIIGNDPNIFENMVHSLKFI